MHASSSGNLRSLISENVFEHLIFNWTRLRIALLVFATYLQNSSQYPIAAKDIETIINRSAEIKKTKTSGQKLTPKQQKELTEKEKEMKSKRKQIHGSI